jgi:hypothetical protein
MPAVQSTRAVRSRHGPKLQCSLLIPLGELKTNDNQALPQRQPLVFAIGGDRAWDRSVPSIVYWLSWLPSCAWYQPGRSVQADCRDPEHHITFSRLWISVPHRSMSVQPLVRERAAES